VAGIKPSEEVPSDLQDELLPVQGAVHDGRGVDPQVAAETTRAAYLEHRGELHAFLVSATRDPELAADCLQESFARLLRVCRSGDAPLDTRAWLFRVGGNLAISAARRRQVMRRWAPWLLSHDVEQSPEGEFLRREDADAVHASLAQLRPDDRVALLMASHGCSGAEIAAALGRSELATRSVLCRARMRLRDAMERQESGR
jgi:RNA polymerase sigma-70 factor (ECF subfamily)